MHRFGPPVQFRPPHRGLMRRVFERLGPWLLVVPSLTASLGPGLVWAAEPPEARANAIYKEAKDLFEGNDFQGALDKVEQAERVYPHPAILLLKGRILRRLGKLKLAEAALQAADSPQLPKPLVKTLADERDALSDDFGRKGELVVVLTGGASSRSDVTLSVDGVVVDGKRFERWILAGRHEVEATAPGSKTWARTVDVTAGKSVTVEVELDTDAGRLTVTVPGGLRGVEIDLDGLAVAIPDGVRVGERTSLSISPGSHEVVCRGPGGESRHKVEAQTGRNVTVICDGVAASGPSTASKVVGWSGVAVGSGLLAYGLYNLAYYAAETSSGNVEVVGDGPLAVSRSTGGAIYAATGAVTGVLAWWLFLRSPDAPSASK
jgi:hypothetical protein